MSTFGLFLGFFLRDPTVLLALIATWLIAAAFLLSKEPRPISLETRLGVIATAAAIAPVIAFTWLPDTGFVWNPGGIWRLFDTSIGGLTTLTGGTDGPLNILLYIPLGVALTARRARLRGILITVAALGAFSLLTECWQVLAAGRTASLGDVAANTVGAAVGGTVVLLGKALRHAAG